MSIIKQGNKKTTPTSSYIPFWKRWIILFLTMLLSAYTLRYPYAIQNFIRGDGLLSLGLHKRAIQQYERAIYLYPEFDQAYSMLAWTYEL